MTEPGALNLDDAHNQMDRIAVAAGVNVSTRVLLRAALYEVAACVGPETVDALVELLSELNLRAGPVSVLPGEPVLAYVRTVEVGGEPEGWVISDGIGSNFSLHKVRHTAAGWQNMSPGSYIRSFEQVVDEFAQKIKEDG